MHRHSLTNGDLSPQWKTINGLDLPESFARTREITAGKLSRAVKKTPRSTYPAVGLTHPKGRKACVALHTHDEMPCLCKVAIHFMYIAE